MEPLQITVGELPTFNATDRRFIAQGFDGFRAVPKPRSELVASGAAAGAVAVGPWDDSEAYYTLNGRIENSSQAQLLAYRMQLLDALPATVDSPIVVADYDGVSRVAYVRRYDKPDITIRGNALLFSFPLVGLDPLKYGEDGAGGVMGVFAGSTWYTTFAVDTAPTPDIYYMPFILDTAPTPDFGYMVFQQDVASSSFPPAVTLTSEGDAISRRLTFEVTGPLDQGDWHLLHEQSGKELWVDLALTSEQTVVLDNYSQTASLDGSSVDSLVFGNWLSFEPGPNTYRLVSGTQSAGFAYVLNALPAYR
jgi:hypothetical protein